MRLLFTLAWVLFAELLAPTPACGQDLGKLVTYSTVAVPATRAVAELSKLTGVPLEGSPSVARDIVILRVKDVPLQEVMNRLAACIDATWEPTLNGHRLVRTPQQLRSEKDAEFALMRDAIANSMGSTAASLAKQGDFGAAKAHRLAIQTEELHKRQPNEYPGWWQETAAIQAQLPPFRLAQDAIQGLDINELAAIPVSDRVVYSNSPTRMQRKLPAKCMAQVQRFLKERTIWSDEFEKVGGTTGANWGISQTAAVRGKPAKMLLSVKNYGGTLFIELNLFDTAGNSLASGYESVSSIIPKKPEPPLPADAKEPKFTFSAIADEIAAADGFQVTGPAQRQVLSAEAKQALSHPEQRDPLSFVPSEALIQTGQARGDNVMACLTDRLVLSHAAFSTSARTPSAYTAYLKALGYVVEEADGWLSVRPRLPFQARANRIDRRALGTLLSYGLKQGAVDLESQARYASALPGLHEDSMAPIMLRLLLADNQMRSDSWALDDLRFYGGVTPNQAVELQVDGITVRQLSPSQRRVAEYLAYSDKYVLQFRPTQQMAADRNGNQFYFSDLFHEPTESLPNGLPIDGRIKMAVTREDVAFTPSGIPGMSGLITMNAGGLAWAAFNAERPDLQIGGYPARVVALDSFHLGTRRRITFNFAYEDVLVMDRMLEETKVSPGGPVGISGLPKSMKDVFDANLSALRLQFKGAKPGQFNGAPPIKPTIPPR